MRTMMLSLARRALLGALLAAVALGAARGERIKDLASVQGVRPNPLIGYGLVVGLDGTGDQTTQTPFTTQSIQSLLSNLGINLPPGANPQLKNVAAVMVTAQLPAFARPGQLLDVTVSSLGNAKSLRGGTLLLTPLKGADGQIYAMAQGNVVVAGAGASAAGSSVQINQLNAGRVPGGATVERPVPTQIASDEAIRLELHTTDFGVAKRVAEAINARWGAVATPLDGRVIAVRAPAAPEAQVGFIAELESLTIESPPAAAKVIINARTGSVVMNRMVSLEPCAIAHGNLSIVVAATPVVSQPAPFGAGSTVLTERADIQIQQEGGTLVYTPGGAQLADVVKALNAMGARPADLLAILQAMKVAGALKAELEVI